MTTLGLFKAGVEFSQLAHCGSMNRAQGNLQATKTFQTLFSKSLNAVKYFG